MIITTPFPTTSGGRTDTVRASRCSTHPFKPLSYARETSNEANIAGALTLDEARRIAVNVAKLRKRLEEIQSCQHPAAL
jgi:hypothetical protein